MPKVKVAFAPIDAKGGATDSYDTVGFYTGKYPGGKHEEKFSKELNILSILMEREYLVRLAQLQDLIEAKYVKLASEITSETPALDYDKDEDYYGRGLNKEEFERAEAAAQKEFPGREADYYT